MGVTYNQVIRSAAIRLNAIAGTTSSTLETSYQISPLTTTQVDSADFTLGVFKDTCLLVEEKLALAIATYIVKDERTGLRHGHPWRASLQGVTSNLANLGTIPISDSASKKIIGQLGNVRDTTDKYPCAEVSLHQILRNMRNANTWRVGAIYQYAIDGIRIYHTRTNVIIDVCVYDRVTQTTAIASLSNDMLLPDVLEEAMVCGIVSMLVRDDAFTQQAAIYRGYFNDTLAMIAQGSVQLPKAA